MRVVARGRWHGYRADGVAVGAIVHTVGDRQRALLQFNTDFGALRAEILSAIRAANAHLQTGTPEAQAAIRHSPIYVWYATFVRPTLDEWDAFYEDQSNRGDLALASTSWDAYESWEQRLRSLRDVARGKLGRLSSAEPTALPTSLVQDAGGVLSSAAGSVGSVAKIAAYAAVGVVGVYAVTKIVSRRRDRTGDDHREDRD